MKQLTKHINIKATPQTQPLPGRSADIARTYHGSYSFKADIWTRLHRFLTIGSFGGTYYADEKTVTIDNLEALEACVSEDGLKVVKMAAEISQSGRAPRNDQAIFVLAYALKKGDLATRREAAAAVSKVNRIGTHIFGFAEAVDAFGGWGRLTSSAIADFYNSMPVERLAYQMVKYQQRDGVSHADLLRRAHVRRNMPDKVADRELREALYGWVCPERPVSDRIRNLRSFPKAGWPWAVENAEAMVRNRLPIVEGFLKIRQAKTAQEAAHLIRAFNLPRECVPTQFLNDKQVWAALLEKMPMTAMIRNLGKMTNVGLLEPVSEAAASIARQLADTERLRKSRIHPLQLFFALRTYAQGHGEKGRLHWSPVPQVIDALDSAFYAAFGNIKPSGKRILLAIDSSGSMDKPASNSIMTCREVAAAMALVTANSESQYYIIGYHQRVMDSLPISPKQRLDDVVHTLRRHSEPERTDCSAPFKWAEQRQIAFDAICLYSDNETWYGNIWPSQAVVKYRDTSGLNTRMVTCDIISNKTQIGDPQDALALHVAGFDSFAPALISNFIADNTSDFDDDSED